MSDLISRQAVIEVIDNHIFYDDYDGMDKIDLINAIKVLPLAEPKIGRWIRHGNPPWHIIECSECGAQWQTSGSWDAINYCPYCGVKMECENE